MPRDGIGEAPKRREDQRFLTGRGRYLDDLAFDRLAHAVVLRSAHAHALIRNIDVEAARAMPGVLAVLTAAEVRQEGLKPLLPYVDANTVTGEKFAFAPQPLLAADKVRYVGEPVALVVADTSERALDAAEHVAVDYQPLPAVIDPVAARAAGAPQIAPEIPRNLCFDWLTGDHIAADAAFVAAAYVTSLSLDNHRVVTNPMEPRGLVGLFDPASGRYTAYVSAQSIHATRDHAARALGVEPAQLRFVAPDVGGGFGAKNFVYPEHVLLPWAAKRVGRPVKWIAGRSEVFLSDHQGRGHQAEAALALDADGRFLALRIASNANLGAYLSGSGGGVQTFQYAFLPGTVYRIPAIALRVVGVFTNTAPYGVLRGPGYAEMVNVVERLIDRAAEEIGLDRAELRRRNLMPAAAMPAVNAFGNSIDSGAFPDTFDKALAAADIRGFAARRQNSEARGRWRGLGFACHIKATGGAPSENVDVRFEPDGGVALITGTQTIGQGHETTFPQILADRLGLPNEQIRLVQGDTDLIPMGGGHGSSRATYMGGTAIWRAADIIIEKGTRIAAEALEAAEADIRFADGEFVVAGTDRRIGLIEVAKIASDAGAPLDTYYAWTREWMTFPNGTHVAEVEIDRDTGAVRLARYSAVDDYGVLVNPMVAAGQAHGAIAQGAGQALLEHAHYDPGSGQLLAGSFMDYALPRAGDLPPFGLGFNPTRCTTNPLGVKGCGEAGAVAAFPAIGNAIRDALRSADGAAGDFTGPATPERVWRALNRH
jgi:carbon-monoxide dehydrogenase large subunit